MDLRADASCLRRGDAGVECARARQCGEAGTLVDGTETLAGRLGLASDVLRVGGRAALRMSAGSRYFYLAHGDCTGGIVRWCAWMAAAR